MARFDLNPSLTKRLRHINEIKKQFWRKWMTQVFQGQMLSQKWRKQHYDAQASDVVSIMNETVARMEFQG